MTCDIQNCLFLLNICSVAPSQFALYMYNTKMYTQGILVSATQFHHSMKVLGIVFIIPVYTYRLDEF